MLGLARVYAWIRSARLSHRFDCAAYDLRIYFGRRSSCALKPRNCAGPTSRSPARRGTQFAGTSSEGGDFHIEVFESHERGYWSSVTVQDFPCVGGWASMDACGAIWGRADGANSRLGTAGCGFRGWNHTRRKSSIVRHYAQLSLGPTAYNFGKGLYIHHRILYFWTRRPSVARLSQPSSSLYVKASNSTVH
jgi:hypothetical protein